MPHQCTSCSRQFADGATEMLSGCPNCGGNRFQFIPEDAADQEPTRPSENRMIEAEPDPDYDPSESDWFSDEDRAQNDARSSVVDPDQLPSHEPDEPSDGPDLEDLREELEEQFGSIKIVSRGEYELNLMELYERREYIIELQENGRYAIQVPEAIAAGEPATSDVPNR